MSTVLSNYPTRHPLECLQVDAFAQSASKSTVSFHILPYPMVWIELSNTETIFDVQFIRRLLCVRNVERSTSTLDTFENKLPWGMPPRLSRTLASTLPSNRTTMTRRGSVPLAHVSSAGTSPVPRIRPCGCAHVGSFGAHEWTWKASRIALSRRSDEPQTFRRCVKSVQEKRRMDRRA